MAQLSNDNRQCMNISITALAFGFGAVLLFAYSTVGKSKFDVARRSSVSVTSGPRILGNSAAYGSRALSQRVAYYSPTCPEGMWDATCGKARWFACAHKCPGGAFGDDNCNCACQPGIRTICTTRAPQTTSTSTSTSITTFPRVSYSDPEVEADASKEMETLPVGSADRPDVTDTEQATTFKLPGNSSVQRKGAVAAKLGGAHGGQSLDVVLKSRSTHANDSTSTSVVGSISPELVVLLIIGIMFLVVCCLNALGLAYIRRFRRVYPVDVESIDRPDTDLPRTLTLLDHIAQPPPLEIKRISGAHVRNVEPQPPQNEPKKLGPGGRRSVPIQTGGTVRSRSLTPPTSSSTPRPSQCSTRSASSSTRTRSRSNSLVPPSSNPSTARSFSSDTNVKEGERTSMRAFVSAATPNPSSLSAPRTRAYSSSPGASDAHSCK